MRQGVSERGWERREKRARESGKERGRGAYWALEQQACAEPVEHDTQYRRVSRQRTPHESSPDRFHADLQIIKLKLSTQGLGVTDSFATTRPRCHVTRLRGDIQE